MMRSIQTILLSGTLALAVVNLPAQNVTQHSPNRQTASPIAVSPEQVRTLVDHPLPLGQSVRSETAERVRAKLEQHVDALLTGAPWKPFHHTLGISGYESYFDHPDELFYSLSIAAPWLTSATQTRINVFLRNLLETHPPFAHRGFDRRAGQDREPYHVPDDLRLSGRGEANSAFGVYAFWAYVHYLNEPEAVAARWPAITSRMAPLLERNDTFDIHERDYRNDEAEILNGDLAGLIGLARLARVQSDRSTEAAAMARLRQVLELRINLERVNPDIVNPTRATKSLHIHKLARFCDLTPEIGEALHHWSDGCAKAHLAEFREARNGWYLAFGDRFIGGENYTNPLHLPRALFAGAALIERLPADQLLGFIDVPWCHADLYFIEACSLALAAAAE